MCGHFGSGGGSNLPHASREGSREDEERLGGTVEGEASDWAKDSDIHSNVKDLKIYLPKGVTKKLTETSTSH